MMITKRFHCWSFTIALVLLGLAWGAGEAVAASPLRTGGTPPGPMCLDPGEVGLLTSTGRGEDLFSSVLRPEGEEQVDRGREEIQVAGPVVRSSRRTARRTSRRITVIHND